LNTDLLKEIMTRSDLLTISCLALLFAAAILLAGQHNLGADSLHDKIEHLEAQLRVKTGPPIVHGKYVTVYGGEIAVEGEIKGNE